jgi:hypothetical protein
VGLGDLEIVLRHYGQATVFPFQGDFDADRDIDLADLARFLADYGAACE